MGGLKVRLTGSMSESPRLRDESKQLVEATSELREMSEALERERRRADLTQQSASEFRELTDALERERRRADLSQQAALEQRELTEAVKRERHRADSAEQSAQRAHVDVRLMRERLADAELQAQRG